MRLAIDGYNLIHSTPELSLAHARGQGRQALCDALRLYREKRRIPVTAVFDGGDLPEGSRASIAGVPVVYSGGSRSADDVLAEMARKHGAGITVITDDRELAGRCQASGAEVVPSWEFGVRLMDVALGGAAEAAAEADGQGWDFTTRKKGPSKRLPKAQRRQKKLRGRL